MNTLYTITINRRKYVTTDGKELIKFMLIWVPSNYEGCSFSQSKTTETIPNVIAL